MKLHFFSASRQIIGAIYPYGQKLFLPMWKIMCNFAPDFEREITKRYASTCEWKPEKFSSATREYNGFAHSAWTVCYFSAQGYSQDPHSKKWYISTTLHLLSASFGTGEAQKIVFMSKNELIQTAKEIISRVHQKDMGYCTIVDVVSESDEKRLSEWTHQLELYLINIKNQKVISTIESLFPIQNGNRIRKAHLQAIIDILLASNED